MYGRWFTSTTAFPFCLGDLGDDGAERPRILGGGGTTSGLDSGGTFRGRDWGLLVDRTRGQAGWVSTDLTRGRGETFVDVTREPLAGTPFGEGPFDGDVDFLRAGRILTETPRGGTYS